MNASLPNDVVRVVLSVPGVAAAEIRPDRRSDSAGTLYLGYQEGVDRLAVADAIDQRLRKEFRLMVDPVRLSAPVAVCTSKLTPVIEFPRGGLVDPPTAAPVTAAVTDEYLLPEEGSGEPEPTAEPEAAAGPEAAAAPHAEPEPEPVSQNQPEPTNQPALYRPEHHPEYQPGYQAPEPGAAYQPGPDQPPPGPGSWVRSAAEPVSPPELPVPVAQSPRLVIEHVQLESTGLTVRATVTLAVSGLAYVGRATGSTAATGVNRSVATATLVAVEAATGGRAVFDVDQIEVVVRGAERAVLIVVAMTTAAGSVSLAGAAVVREDLHQAVMRASLDAVNRRVGPLLPRPAG